MADTETNRIYLSDAAVQRLVELGMPMEIARSVQVSPGLSRRAKVGTGLLTLVIMLVFIPSLIVLYMAICDPAVWVALGLIPADTIAVDVEQFSVGLAIFVAIAATGVTTGLLASLNKDLAICSAITAIQQYSSRASRSMAILPGRAIRNISPDLSRDDYLAAYPRAESGFAFRLMLGLVVISVAFMLWDAHSATCATPQWLRVGSRFWF